jgi:hypothetical protein
MRDTVDYRLLERFQAHRRLNLEPPAPPDEPKRAAAGAARRGSAESRRAVRALDLRD